MSRACRGCGGADLRPVLDFGEMPLANRYLTREELDRPEPRYPLTLAFCQRCALAQITETVPPEMLFRQYLYFSSYSDTMLAHAKEMAQRLIRERRLGPGSLVVEVASNDGYLLRYFKEAGIPVLGIEPASNVAAAAEKNGIPTLNEFFSEKLSQLLRIQGSQADVVIANNVFAHVADVTGFVKGLRTLTKEEGVAVIEVPYVREMVERCEFDTIYHEHVFYFSVTSLAALLKRHGLMLSKVERIPIHGGSLRLFVTHGDKPANRGGVESLLREEAGMGMGSLDYYLDFARRAAGLKESIRKLVTGLKQSGKRIAAYGAAAKGTVLLNGCGLGSAEIDFVADRSPHKQGRYMPGVHIPIFPPGRLLEEKPDFTLLLTWNLADEILNQQTEYQSCGGRFIVPLPRPEIIEWSRK